MFFSAFPFLRYTLVLIAGILTYLLTNFYHPILPYLLLGFVLLFLFIKSFRGFTALMSLFLFAWLWAYQKTPTNQTNHYTHFTEIENYQAVITSNVEEKPKTYKVEAEIQQIRQNKHWQKASGKLLLYFVKTDTQKPNYGDVFVLKGSPRSIEAPKNPEEFNYQAFLNNKGIYAHHFLRNNDFLKIANEPQNLIMDFALKANLYADYVFTNSIKTPNEYAVANAMVVGLRDDIDNELLQAYSASGAIHVLSVSGMHVAILFLMLGWCFQRLKKLKFGNIYFATTILTFLWTYAIFTGLSSTVLRATIMFSFVVLAEALNRKSNIYNTFAISAFCLLLYNPYWVADVGFQLSYLAILGIVYIHPMLNQIFTLPNKVLNWLWNLTSVSLTAQIATFPLSLYYFHQFPTYFLLANPFVFLFSEGILPLGLLLLMLSKVPLLGEIVLALLKLSLQLLNYSIFAIEKLPLSTLKGFSISLPETILLYMALAFGLYFFQSNRINYLRLSLLILMTLFGFNFYQDYKQSQQSQITIHYIPKQSGISFVKGKSVIFLADSAITNNPRIYNFHLKNYYDKIGITEKKYQDTNTNTAFKFNNFNFFYLKDKQNFDLKQKIDYLIISNNACKTLSDLPLQKINKIILDDTNRKTTVQKLQKQADSLNVSLISLYEHGSYTIY